MFINYTKRVIIAILAVLFFAFACDEDEFDDIDAFALNELALKVDIDQKRYAGFPEERIAIDKQSREHGLMKNNIELYERLPGPGKVVVKEKLMKVFRHKQTNSSISFSDIAKKIDESEKLYITGESEWYFEIWGDGTKVRYANWNYIDDYPKKYVELDKRLPANVLTRLAKTFIQNYLAETVTLKKGEKLVPYLIRRQIDTQGADHEEDYWEKVVANIVYFTRTINGTAVIGSGSKVSVVIANDGEAIGFSYDWPEYALINEEQELLEIADIYERVSRLGFSIPQADILTLSNFECGYIDSGLVPRLKAVMNNAPMQAGCLAAFYGEQQVADKATGKISTINTSTVILVPAGVEIINDETWLETRFLIEKSDMCVESMATKALPISTNNEV